MKLRKRETIYESAKPVWDQLAGMGYPSLVAVSKHFYSVADMARALGVTGPAVGRWRSAENIPTVKMEQVAGRWIADQREGAGPKPGKDAGDLPLFSVAPPGAAMLIVSCPQEALPKVQRVLGIMGCTSEAVS